MTFLMTHSPRDYSSLLLPGEVDVVRHTTIGTDTIAIFQLLLRADGEPRASKDYMVARYRDGRPTGSMFQTPDYLSAVDAYEQRVADARRASTEEYAGRAGVEREARPGTAKALYERYGAVGTGNRRRGRKTRAA